LTDVAAASRVSGLHPSSLILPPFPRRPRRRAFTLTELLVVIAIIAVLAAMVSVGVMRALDTAKQTRIKTEVDQLDTAFKAYREKYGSFPPATFTGAAISSHIARAFPRYDATTYLGGDLALAGFAPPIRFRPDQALVFWLQGFSPDPTQPFITPDGFQIIHVAGASQKGPNKVTVTPLFDFDKSRLAAVGTGPVIVPSYFPQGTKADATGAPYLYWDSQSLPMGGVGGPLPPFPLNPMMWNVLFPPTMPAVLFPNAGGVRPYALDANGNGRLSDPADTTKLDPGDGWVNPDSFQIISAGMDGKYGSLAAVRTDPARIYPTGTSTDITSAASYDLAGADDDNVTNFCPKARLGDAKP
jgi:prepilin-type N-terminal cleavage/methylation domain-containing protein